MKFFITVFCLMLFLVLSFGISIAQVQWTKDPNNPILSGGAEGSWNRHVWSPRVLYNQDSLRYEMWYTASDGPPSWEPYRIGYAISDDGMNWTMSDSAVLIPDQGAWDESGVVGSMVIRENGTYKMWYTGWSTSDEKGKIGYATSPDGIHWTKYPSNPVMTPGTAAWEVGGPHWANVMAVGGGGYKMWYTGYTSDYAKGEIGYATSADGINWNRADSVNPVLKTGVPGRWDDTELWGSVFLFNNTYHMWYIGHEPPDNIRQTGWATSSDGIHWIKYNDPSTITAMYYDSDPVLKPTSGHWDGNYAQATTVMVAGDSLRMWYAGSGYPQTTYPWRIGHATAPLKFKYVPNQYATIQEAIDAAKDEDVILVDEGTYYENINFRGKAITVASLYYFDGDTSHSSKTIIDGSQPSNPDSGSVVYFISGEDTTSVLMGFTITNGSGTNCYYTMGGVQYPSRSGGGIFCWNSGGRFVSNKIMNNTITGDEPFGGGFAEGDYGSDAWIILENNTIINNTLNGGTEDTYGGGVGLSNNGRLFNNIISHNSCISTGNNSEGGGVHISTELKYPRTVIVKKNHITDNFVQGKGTSANDQWAAFGGGICNKGSKVLIIEKNEISHNQLTDVGTGNGSGAGIYMYLAADGSVINGNTISYNTSECTGTNYGGGICLGTCYGVSITNNIISENSATQGGGIRLRDFDAEILNNTIINNTASTSGGGLYFQNSQPIVINSILWNNQAVNNAGIYPSSLAKVRYSDIQGGYAGTGNINADPLFADTIFYELTANSPCVGTGTDTLQISGIWYYAPINDYDGDPRPNPVDSFVDMGAQESDFLPDGIVNDKSDYVPNSFSLKQNYPNPFNPVTNIKFSIPKTEFVTLKIYNLLGQKVATLVWEKLTPGTYTYTWDASGFASGVYLYMIKAGNFSQVRKMIVLR